MIKERKYTLCFLGFLSFFGFSGLNGNPYNLLWFSFAGYFSYFWWAKLGQIDNESLKKNKSRACVISYRIYRPTLGRYRGWTQIHEGLPTDEDVQRSFNKSCTLQEIKKTE